MYEFRGSIVKKLSELLNVFFWLKKIVFCLNVRYFGGC